MNFKFKILFHEQYVKYLILYHFGLEFVYKPKFVKYSYCNKDKKKTPDQKAACSNHVGVKL